MTQLPSRMSVVTLGARDLPRLRRFYEGLGWPAMAGSDDGWAGFLLGGVVLTMYPLEALAAEAAPGLPIRISVSNWATGLDEAEIAVAAIRRAADRARAAEARSPAGGMGAV